MRKSIMLLLVLSVILISFGYAQETVYTKASETTMRGTIASSNATIVLSLTQLKKTKATIEAQIEKLQTALALTNEQIRIAEELGLREVVNPFERVQ